MKRVILAVDSSFPGNRTWGFVDSSYAFTTPTNPFPHKDSIMLNSLTDNQSNKSFIGFILGDVNWSATSPRKVNGKSIELYYNNINTHNGNTVSVTITANNFNNMIGMQYTIHYNQETFDFVGISNNLLGIEYAKHDGGNISFFWNEPTNEGKTLQDGTVILELVLKPKTDINNESINISSDITAIEAVDGNINTYNITLEKANSNDIIFANETWNLAPNPTYGVITVNLLSKENNTINFVLTDIAGRILMNKNAEVIKGNNNFKLNLKEQNKIASGTYYLKANGIEADKFKKVIVR